MSRMIFVTTELNPETGGGAGVAIDALARGLAGDRECIVVLLHSEPVETVERHGVEVVPVQIPQAPEFWERSRAAARAVADIARAGDRVEFQDFEGIAFHALTERVALGLGNVAMTVRFHGPYDLLLDGMETRPESLELPAAMEREVFAMADLVLVPVASHLPTMVEEYGVEASRVVVCPLPVPELSPIEYSPSKPPVFAVLGRLGEVKGSQDAVLAALRLLARKRDLQLRFIGGDGWSPTHGPMQEWLKSLAGAHVDAVEFRGQVERDRLPQELSGVTAVVVPSRFESFCLAAYEARRMGLPVILPDIAAFRGLFGPDTGALVYDGSVKGLTRAMGRLTKNQEEARQLAAKPVPHPGEPWASYEQNVPIWHTRSQAGMGTAAGQNLEVFMREGPPPAKPNLLQKLYRVVPSPVVNLAYRFFPQRLKQVLASRASWSMESKRRAEELEAESRPPALPRGRTEVEARLASVTGLISQGEFNEQHTSPDVSVVIPVYNDVVYLDETLASVYEQTHDSWEIVVVDDGSTDQDARDYLRTLKRPRLRIVRQRNKGLPGARNAGIREARGRFVIPLDADDQLLPNYMEIMMAALEEEPSVGYAHCYAVLHHDIDAIWVTRPFNPYWQLLSNGVFGCAMIRMDALEQVGGYDTSMKSGNEDWELWLRLMAAGWDQAHIREPLVMYRKHGVSMSVRTESRFEAGRRSILERHPDLYGRLAETKRSWYPSITSLGEPEGPVNVEVEVIEDVDRLSDTWGKYVIDLRGASATGETLLEMAQALEANPDSSSAMTTGSPPLIMVRRWNLHDPDAAPKDTLTLDLPATGPLSQLPDHIPRPGWSPPQLPGDEWRPIQRQRPEEDAQLPDTSTW